MYLFAFRDPGVLVVSGILAAEVPNRVSGCNGVYATAGVPLDEGRQVTHTDKCPPPPFHGVVLLGRSPADGISAATRRGAI